MMPSSSLAATYSVPFPSASSSPTLTPMRSRLPWMASLVSFLWRYPISKTSPPPTESSSCSARSRSVFSAAVRGVRPAAIDLDRARSKLEDLSLAAALALDSVAAVRLNPYESYLSLRRVTLRYSLEGRPRFLLDGPRPRRPGPVGAPPPPPRSRRGRAETAGRRGNRCRGRRRAGGPGLIPARCPFPSSPWRRTLRRRR